MIKFKAALTISFTLSCIILHAQEQDSLDLMQNQIYRQHFENLKSNPVQYVTLPLADFTETTLQFESRDLNMKRAQTAGQITEYGFGTDGIYNISEKLDRKSTRLK